MLQLAITLHIVKNVSLDEESCCFNTYIVSNARDGEILRVFNAESCQLAKRRLPHKHRRSYPPTKDKSMNLMKHLGLYEAWSSHVKNVHKPKESITDPSFSIVKSLTHSSAKSWRKTGDRPCGERQKAENSTSWPNRVHSADWERPSPHRCLSVANIRQLSIIIQPKMNQEQPSRSEPNSSVTVH